MSHPTSSVGTAKRRIVDLDQADPQPGPSHRLTLAYALMPRMNSVIEIDAGEDRKHVGLKKRHQQFECGQRNRQCQWQYAPQPADCAERGAEQGDEAGEHLERDMP